MFKVPIVLFEKPTVLIVKGIGYSVKNGTLCVKKDYYYRDLFGILKIRLG